MPINVKRLKFRAFWRSHCALPRVTLSLTLPLVASILTPEGSNAYSGLVGNASDQQVRCCSVPSDLGRVLVNQTQWPLPDLHNSGRSKTPRMGFSYWNGFGDNPGPSDQLSRQIADALVTTGLRDAGYVYFLAFGQWKDILREFDAGEKFWWAQGHWQRY